MAEAVLLVVGGVASVAQIIEVLVKTSNGIADFCREVSNAPRVIQRVKGNLKLLQQLLEDVQTCTNELESESVLPPETRRLMQSTAEQMLETLKDAQLVFQKSTSSSSDTQNKDSRSSKSSGAGNRIIWALRDKPALKRVQAEIEEFDRLLSLVIQFANMRLTLSHYQAFLGAQERKNSEITLLDSEGKFPRARQQPNQLPTLGLGSAQCKAWGAGPALRWFGFYGEIMMRSSAQYLFAASANLGYKLPAWLWAQSFDIEFSIFIPHFIRPQRRVPLDSPFLTACRNGDVWQIRQCLSDRVGAVSDRAMCNGMTPLLVSSFQRIVKER